jgi:predicted GIY-YIG superfamily endonuclease
VTAVYILQCADGSLYIGETGDLASRLVKHHDGSACAFTAKRRPVTLVYSENHATRAASRERERQRSRDAILKPSRPYRPPPYESPF